MLTLTLPVERLPPPPRRSNPWLGWAALLAVAALAWLLSGCRLPCTADSDCAHLDTEHFCFSCDNGTCTPHVKGIEPLAACTGPGCDDTPPPAPQTPQKAPRKPAKPAETPSPTQGTPPPRKAYAGRSVRIWGVDGGMQAGTL